jgi:prephenate dehydratase
MGEYIFFVDLELSAAESQAAESGAATGLEDALAELRPLCEHLALFGTYPLTVVV